MAAPVKPTVPLAALEALAIRVGTIPVLAVPERAIPDGTRAG